MSIRGGLQFRVTLDGIMTIAVFKTTTKTRGKSIQHERKGNKKTSQDYTRQDNETSHQTGQDRTG